MKYYEYLSAGLPVVSTWSGGIEQFKEVLSIAQNHDDFIRLIEEALDTNSPIKEAQRRAFVSGMTWKQRVTEVLADVEGLSQD